MTLPRATLHRLPAIRTTHGDFSWYHEKFRHEKAELKCSCGRHKTPEHLVMCRKVQKPTMFRRWPLRPAWPPGSRKEALTYLGRLLANPDRFQEYLKLTRFYSEVCTR